MDLFFRYSDHIAFIRLKEYYGMPRGGGTWEKGDQYYIQTRHNNFFFLITIFF